MSIFESEMHIYYFIKQLDELLIACGLGGVDGFDQDKVCDESEDGSESSVWFSTQRRATRLKRLSLPTACSMRARPSYSALAKKAGLFFSFIVWGMTGMMPRSRATLRLALLASPCRR